MPGRVSLSRLPPGFGPAFPGTADKRASAAQKRRGSLERLTLLAFGIRYRVCEMEHLANWLSRLSKCSAREEC